MKSCVSITWSCKIDQAPRKTKSTVKSCLIIYLSSPKCAWWVVVDSVQLMAMFKCFSSPGFRKSWLILLRQNYSQRKLLGAPFIPFSICCHFPFRRTSSPSHKTPQPKRNPVEKLGTCLRTSLICSPGKCAMFHILMSFFIRTPSLPSTF